MSEPARRALRAVAAILLAAATSVPSLALAHPSGRGFVLLLPTGYYFAGGVTAVVASFLVLAFLPPDATARLSTWRHRLPSLPDGLRIAISLLSLGVFVALIAAGFFGSRDPLSNPLPLFVWTVLWIGFTVVQGTIGDVWRWIDPWYGAWRLAGLVRGSEAPLIPLPVRTGYWPAVLGFFAFAWFELIDPAPDDPARLAWVLAVYLPAHFAGMVLFGHEAWSRRGEPISAFYRLLAQFALTGNDREGRPVMAVPGSRIADADPLPPSGVALLLLALASVSFDGLSRTFFWIDRIGFNPLEFPGRTAVTTANSLGLAGSFLLLAATFALCVLVGEWLAGQRRLFPAAGLLVWSIVPIALAYHVAHYLAAFLVYAQYALVAASDPFSLGWNLFGTAGLHVAPGVVMGQESAWLMWNAQAGAIVVGHVLAVLAAHGIALRLHASPEQASISQLPLTLLMVGYTVLGLWLLATPTAA